MKQSQNPPPLARLAALLLLLAMAIPAGAQTTIREGNDILVNMEIQNNKMGTEARVAAALAARNSIPVGCGVAGSDACFTIERVWPSAAYIRITAVADDCRNGTAARQVTVDSTTYQHQDDDWYPRYTCANPQVMTKYNQDYRHGYRDTCRAHEISSGQECLAKCLDTQIWREAGWIPLGGTEISRVGANGACETWK